MERQTEIAQILKDQRVKRTALLEELQDLKERMCPLSLPEDRDEMKDLSFSLYYRLCDLCILEEAMERNKGRL